MYRFGIRRLQGQFLYWSVAMPALLVDDAALLALVFC
jgi:hypothetical protein